MYTDVIPFGHVNRVHDHAGIPSLPRPTNTLGITPIVSRTNGSALDEHRIAPRPMPKTCRPKPKTWSTAVAIRLGLMVIDAVMAEELRRVHA